MTCLAPVSNYYYHHLALLQRLPTLSFPSPILTMTAVHENLEQAQDFIRLLRSENNALRKQIQELEKPIAVS